MVEEKKFIIDKSENIGRGRHMGESRVLMSLSHVRRGEERGERGTAARGTKGAVIKMD